MAVVIVLRNKQDLHLTHWAARLASARRVKLCLLWAQQKRGGKKIVNVGSIEDAPDDLVSVCHDLLENGFRFEHAELPKQVAAEESSVDLNLSPKQDLLPLEVVSITSEDVHLDVASQLEQLKVTCLVMPRDSPSTAGVCKLYEHLLSVVSCEIVLLTASSSESGNCREIVTPVADGPNSASCLRLAHDLASNANARLIALHVTPEIDVTAKQAALDTLGRNVDRALGDHQRELVKKHIELSNNPIDGIKATVTEETDLIVLGIRRSGLSRRLSAGGLAEKLIAAKPGATVAVIQSAIPISSWLGTKIDELMCGIVPQLPRDRRIELVGRIQSSSEWDFDFIMLICLSTIIAAGGLIQDSAAVVIGAMLVAPLMTPLLGSGLAIVQGNRVLFKNTLLTVGKGFVLALIIGFLVAFFSSLLLNISLTEQMQQRGNPSPLDIAVAMVGGIAAAYASGRPNLLSALPGVAIAAALVPPLATSGISIYLGEFGLAFRAALLFFTNIVAIILGTAFAFRATGIRGHHEFGTFDRWTIPVAALLVMMAISLGFYESLPTTHSTGFALIDRINQMADGEWECASAEHQTIDGEGVLTIRLKVTGEIPDETIDRIRIQAIRESQSDTIVHILIERESGERPPPD